VRRAALFAGALLLAAAVAAPSTTATAAPDDVYRLTVTATSGQAIGTWTEWVAPASGRWRIEQGDRTYVYTGTQYVVFGDGSGAYVRTGSAAFLGSFPNRAVTRDPLRAQLAGAAGVKVTTLPDGRVELEFTKGSTSYTATIEETIPAADAAARGLFAVPLAEVTSSSTERTVGLGPAPPLVGYWFGATYAGTKATAAVEQYSGPSPDERSRQTPPREAVASFVVLYERPAANGRSSAIPGQRAPAGEIQVLSQPVSSSAAKRAIQAYNGRNGNLRYRAWPRSVVTLRSGERATVIPDRSESLGPVRRGFAVVTKTTLVNVSGSFKLTAIPAAAALLRQLPPTRL
jgi:hypothetical protein